MATLFERKYSALDFKVTLHETSLVLPSTKTPRRNMFLSNIDQSLNVTCQLVMFFQANPNFPPQMVPEMIKKALSTVLVAYDFLAGRLKTNPDSGRFEIDCNEAGARFVVASSNSSLSRISELGYPNPAVEQLAIHPSDNLDPDGNQPLFIIQMTSFICGGIAMGLSFNHITLDGTSMAVFLQNLASQVAGKPLAVIPCNDRTLLASRCPPHVTFDHPELFEIKSTGHQQNAAPTIDCSSESLDFKLFHLTSNDISFLKKMARADRASSGVFQKFSLVVALVWRCKVLSSDTCLDMNKPSTVIYTIDIRSRMSPPLPESYTGNAIFSGYATALIRDLERGPFSKVVELVEEGIDRVTNDYVRSAIDWGELHKGFALGDFIVSSWVGLGLEDVEWPWGKPIFVCPSGNMRKGPIVLLRDTNNGKDGTIVSIALPSKNMVVFERLFNKCLGRPQSSL